MEMLKQSLTCQEVRVLKKIGEKESLPLKIIIKKSQCQKNLGEDISSYKEIDLISEDL